MVETIRLESGHTLTGIVGSNPTLSAIPSLSSTYESVIPRLIPDQEGSPMANREVNLTKRIQTSKGLRCGFGIRISHGSTRLDSLWIEE